MKEFIRTHKRVVLLCLAAVLVVAAAIGGTLAWITSRTYGLTNTFDPKEVPNEVHETFTQGGTTKSNVQIKNVGDMPAYIRVALVPVWRNLDGSGAGIPASLDQFTIATLPEGSTPVNKWVLDDGYYYYTEPVAPGASTQALIDTATVNTTKEGKYLELQILSQSIQALGMGAESAQEAFEIALAATTQNPGA